MALGRFWREQVDELRRRVQIRRMLAELPGAPGCVDGGSYSQGLDPSMAAAAASDVISGERSVHAVLCGDPHSELMRKLRWVDMLGQAYAQGAERMVVLDAAEPDGVAADVDVELGLFAAQLDVLDALAPSLRDVKLAERTKTHIQDAALHAMANRNVAEDGRGNSAG